MSARTIRRGQTARSKASWVDTRKSKGRAVAVRSQSLGARLLRLIPLDERQWRALISGALLAGFGAMAWGLAEISGAADTLRDEWAAAAQRAGFEVKRVEVRGVDRMNELKIYEIVLAEKDRAMPQVDIGELRERLMRFGWIADARVSRQLPDTLVVDVVERVPYARWRRGGQVVLIDRDGVVLEPVAGEDAGELVELAGPDANRHAAALATLLESAPALVPQVSSAEWVGNRRWNIGFRSGEVIALPEGEAPSRSAWLAFARMDGVNRLLGGEIAFFDLRDPERAYLRRIASTPAADADAEADASEGTE